MRALMWFRSDLRVQDNTALHRACLAADDGVVAVFAMCSAQWLDHHWGTIKVAFILRNLRELSEQLDKLNIPLLLVRRGLFKDVPRALLRLAKKHHCDELFFNKEYEVNEVARDKAAVALFKKSSRKVHPFDDQVVVDVAQIRSSSGGYYTVFTPFKRKWHEWFGTAGPAGVLPKPKRQANLKIAPSKIPRRLSDFRGPARDDLWTAGERVAQKRLREFVSKRISAYEHQRDFPDVNGTSTLSPYLAAGILSPRQCVFAALNSNQGRLDSGKKGVVTWISELIWREFYRHVLIGFPHVCRNRPFKLETEALKWNSDEVLFEAWCEGQTGVPIVDAAMRQLNNTGWMHNRLRMIVAMFLSKNLFLDWRWGERYFMNKLVDGDFASNNGGWQWSASTGTDAAPYFRIFNPFSQAKKFDPKADFIRRFVPQLEKSGSRLIHDEKRRAVIGNYPQPVVDVMQTRKRAIDAFTKLS